MTTSEDKKQIILEAAISVITEKGVLEASMNDIIKASGFSKGGVYHYFSSKEEIILSILNSQLSEHHLNVLSALNYEHPIIPQLEMKVDAMAEGFQHLYQYMAIFAEFFVHSARNEKSQAMLLDSYINSKEALVKPLKLAQKNGEIKPEVNVDRLVTGMMAMVDGLAITKLFAQDQIHIGNEFKEAITAILNGIRS